MENGRPLLVGVDVGTSSTKTILVDVTGQILAYARWEYPMHRPYPNWAENDPEDWVRAVEGSVRQVVAKSGVERTQIKGLCIVAQRDPIVLLDENDAILAPSISWTDRRDRSETEEVYDDFGRERLLQTNGLVPVPGLTLPNIYWIRRHLPDAWRRTRRILSTKDYILYRLTGKIATDTSTPSRSMLYDVAEEEWSDWICEKAEINKKLLPPIQYRPWEVWDSLSSTAAKRLGLAPGTILAAGGGDDPCAALGVGAIDTGEVVVGTGTAACWRIVTDRYQPDLSGHADISPHLVPDRYVYELVLTGTGTSLRWFKDAFYAGVDSADVYEVMLDEAAQVDLGSDGLLFYPYLEGARFPRFNNDATGVFFGLLPSHRREHFVRAIIEGIAFQYPPVLEALDQYGIEMPSAITLVDAEARSALWNQIKADTIGIEVHTPHVLNAAAMGAAILAALAAGLFQTAADAVNSMISPGEVYAPISANHQFYDEVRQRYERVYQYLDQAYTS